MRSILALAVTVLLTSSLFAAPRQTSSPNFIFIVIDTLRFDAVSAANTPFLDSLRSRSVVFTNAYSTHDFTPPSHFSLMTGLRDGLDTTDDRVENSLPYQLQTALNYETFAISANALIRPRLMPVFRAFNRFDDLTAPLGSDADILQARTEIAMRLALFRCAQTPHNESSLYYSASRILPKLRRMILDARAPYFAFVNLMDAHEPYVPDPNDYVPETHLPAGFTGDIPRRHLSAELQAPDSIPDPARRAYVKKKIDEAGSPALVSIDLSPGAIGIYKKRYMAKVREADASLRRFFTLLDESRALDNTYVVITGDHGESFGESDLITHNFDDRGDYESTHHVPLMIVLPAARRAAAGLITRHVSNASLAPTIYDLARLDASAFRKKYPLYPISLAPLFTKTALDPVAAVTLPKSNVPADAEAARARAKLLGSLGYIQ